MLQFVLRIISALNGKDNSATLYVFTTVLGEGCVRVFSVMEV